MITVKRTSHFKDPQHDNPLFENWVQTLEKLNGYSHEQKVIQTSLGKTQVYGFNWDRNDLKTLVIFPGFRTTTLIWDLDKGLSPLKEKYRIFMIETNGQPNLSDGNSPAIRSLDYGYWGKEVFDALEIEKAYISGASFGGLVCMKIAIVMPERIEAAILLNPGCFRLVSMGFTNLYFNFLPIIKTTKENIQKFADKIVYKTDFERLSKEGNEHLLAFLNLAITRYKDNTQKPYYMGKQLDRVKTPVYLIHGKKDILIPYKKSIRRAKKHLGDHLKGIFIEDYGHGIELYSKAIQHIDKIMEQ